MQVVGYVAMLILVRNIVEQFLHILGNSIIMVVGWIVKRYKLTECSQVVFSDASLLLQGNEDHSENLEFHLFTLRLMDELNKFLV